MTESATSTQQQAARSLIPLAIWTTAWVASLAAAKFLPELMGEYQAIAAWVLIGLNIVVGIVWIVVYARYLRLLDDLQRKIQMEALVLALGGGFVGAMAVSVANSAGLVSFGADAATFAIIASIVYIVATIIGNLRYR